MMAALKLCCRRASSCTMIVSTLLLSIQRNWNIDLNRAECFTEAFSVFSRPWHSSQSNFQTLSLCVLHKYYQYYTLLMMFVTKILCSDFFYPFLFALWLHLILFYCFFFGVLLLYHLLAVLFCIIFTIHTSFVWC